MKPYVIIFTIFFLFFSSILYGQTEKISKRVNVSSDIAYTEDFSGAIRLYKQMLLFDEKNPVGYYKLGFCYLNTFSKQDSSIAFLHKASKLYTEEYASDININEIDFNLARAYRVNNFIDSAIIILEHLKQRTDDKDFLKIIDNEITLSLQEINNTINIANLGEIINSPYTEHSPVFSFDKTFLIFTSRKQNNENSLLLSDGQYDENIYLSKRVNGVWSLPEPISPQINTEGNEASIGLSCEGNKLFIYKDEKKGSIFCTEKIDEQWTTPVKLGKNINTRHRETHASITCDGKYLYFTSDRPGGEGGLDIYVSQKLADGTWGKAVNLGKGVNSKEDEDGPYISADGKTLYFCSNGHKGYGGFDIFKSEKTQFGTWGYAENLGYPTNSINNDVYYVPVPNSDKAFYSSYKSSGYGQADIYLLSNEENDTNYTVNFANIPENNDTIPNAIIYLYEPTTGKNYEYRPNEIGNFIFITEKEKDYQLTIEIDEQIVYSHSFYVPENSPPKQRYKPIIFEFED